MPVLNFRRTSNITRKDASMIAIANVIHIQPNLEAHLFGKSISQSFRHRGKRFRATVCAREAIWKFVSLDRERNQS
jgi:hypothetical protein